MGDGIPTHSLMGAPQKMTHDAGFRRCRCGWKGISIALLLHRLIAPTVWGEIEIYSSPYGGPNRRIQRKINKTT